MTNAPDYTEYTLDQLYDAYHHIDKDKYPERYISDCPVGLTFAIVPSPEFPKKR